MLAEGRRSHTGQQAAVPKIASGPLVSVVIPCYRQAHFLPTAIESVMAQTYEPVEVVVVDDESPDDVAAAVATYPEVRLVRQANRGLSAARNAGLRAARGAYLLFLDADDWLLPRAVEAGLQALGEAPAAAFAAGAHRMTEPDGVTLGPTLRPRRGGDPYAELLRGNHIGMHAAVLYRRAALEGARGFDERLPACEDYDLYLRLVVRYPVQYHEAVVAVYRRHGANMSHQAGFMLDAALRVLRRQRTLVTHDPLLMSAYMDGIRFWKQHYGSVQLDQVLSDARRGRLRESAEGWVGLASRAPLWLAGRIVDKAVRAVRGTAREALSQAAPGPVQRALARRRGRTWTPPLGRVDFGDFRRLTPISETFGYDRGTPVDRYYIERFLAEHAGDVRGRILEIGDATYTRRFGGGRVTRADILHVVEGNPEATFVDDLTDGSTLPSAAFDCIVLTQTLHVIYDVRAALATLARILKPGGVLLATFPGLSQIVYDDWGDEWHWGFTAQSATRLLQEVFPPEGVSVAAHGNVLAATAFLQGLATEELTAEELNYRDPSYQLVLTARAVNLSPGEPLAGRWDYAAVETPAPYGDDTTYRKGMAFLDGHGRIEDWGCGTTYARRFVDQSEYVGIDGSPSPQVDVVADLTSYRSRTPCLFMRHVLEHNPDWDAILTNALASFTRRMVLIIFTPFVEATGSIAHWQGIPDIAFRKEDLLAYLAPFHYTEEAMQTDTQYRGEHLFYIERANAEPPAGAP